MESREITKLPYKENKSLVIVCFIGLLVVGKVSCPRKRGAATSYTIVSAAPQNVSSPFYINKSLIYLFRGTSYYLK